jgi:hypothetical protein
MADRIRIIKHEAVPLCGSFEVGFPDGRPSQYFYFDDMPGRRMRPNLVDRATARARQPSFLPGGTGRAGFAIAGIAYYVCPVPE